MNTENKSFTDPAIKDSWQTPPEIFNKLNAEFKFQLDTAASDVNHLCNKWLTEEMDSLTHDWSKVNWCNPPYSKIAPWVDKAKEEHRKGNTTVMLIPADTSVKWFKAAYDSCTEVRFISGRVAFVNATTKKPVKGNNKGSVLFIWYGGLFVGHPIVELIDRDLFYKKLD